jgi:hypothetical protein
LEDLISGSLRASDIRGFLTIRVLIRSLTNDRESPVSEHEAKAIPNTDYLGRPYDVVAMDLSNLGASAKNQSVIDISSGDGRAVVTRD